MKIIRKTISALLLAGIGITSIQAQNNSPQAWTLRQCIDYAIEHNIEIRQSTNSRISEPANEYIKMIITAELTILMIMQTLTLFRIR